MKKTLKYLLTCTLSLLLHSSVFAQTLNVKTGSVLWQFPAVEAGDMPYSDGTTLTIMDKVFDIADISTAYIDTATVTSSTVAVVYNGNSAMVSVAGNIAKYITASVSGAHVYIAQSDEVVTEITYDLSGTSANGSLYLAGSYKCGVTLNSLTLTCPDSAAINIRNGKRIALTLNGTNTIADGSGGTHKACFMVKGHPEVTGSGTLTLTGNTAHAFKSNEYLQLKKKFTGSIIVASAVGDGLHIGQYLHLNNGKIQVLSCGDDGVQVEATDDLTDEYNGQCFIYGGELDITITATAGKGLKSDSAMTITDGTLNITTSGGGTWDATEQQTSACACLKAGGALTISGGEMTLKSTGQGGKGISGDDAVNINGGVIYITTTGTRYTYSSGSSGGGGRPGGGGGGGYGGSQTSSNYRSSPKGIKADGAITITGGLTTVFATGAAEGSEGIESKSTINISGGQVFSNSYDDAINSASHFTISDGYVCGYSTGNDGLDANGNCYIQGGTVYAIGKSSPELGIDANTEGGYKLYVSGGTIVAIGGLESGASLTQSCYSASSWSKSTWYALYNSGNLALAFKTPASGGTKLVVSTSGTTTLKSGVTVSGGTSIFNNMAYPDATVSGGSTVSLSSYSGGNSGGGGGGGRWW